MQDCSPRMVRHLQVGPTAGGRGGGGGGFKTGAEDGGRDRFAGRDGSEPTRHQYVINTGRDRHRPGRPGQGLWHLGAMAPVAKLLDLYVSNLTFDLRSPHWPGNLDPGPTVQGIHLLWPLSQSFPTKIDLKLLNLT